MNALPGEAVARPLVLVSWDGRSEPLRFMQADARPDFDLLLFDYSGQSREGPSAQRGQPCQLLSATTECKGEIYAHLARWLAARTATPEWIGVVSKIWNAQDTGAHPPGEVAR